MSKLRYKVAGKLVWVANNLVRSNVATTPGSYPLYRPVDQTAPGEKWACGAYSLEGLRSLVSQGDGDMTVEFLISDEGWQTIDTPKMAQEVADELNKAVTLEATRKEQKELNK